MQGSPRPKWHAHLFRIVFFLTLLLGVYYFFAIRPVIRLSRALTASETRLANQRNQLLANRVALTGFARLDPASANLGQEIEGLLSGLQQSNTEGLTLAAKTSPAASLSRPSGPALKFYNEHLVPVEAELSAKTKTLWQDQQPLISKLVETNRVLKNIFLYPPSDDLGLIIHSKENAEILTARAEDAQSGLTTITANVSSFLDSKAKTTLLQTLKKTQTALNFLLRQLTSDQQSTSAQAQRSAIKQFFALKKVALDYELSAIRSPETVALLTRQTNLLLEYDFWIKNIVRHKRAIFSVNQP